MAAEDRENLKQKADLAISTFRASFGEKLENTPALLEVVAFNEAINTMMTWVSQVLPLLEREESGILSKEVFDDMNQCSNRLKSLTSETGERGQPSLWPFIRKIKFVQSNPSRLIIRTTWLMYEHHRVYMRAHILSRGLILADLPGRQKI